jgi:hypothetical protein
LFDSPPEMPQAVGDVVGRAFRACRQNISVIIRVLLVPTIFQTIAGVVLQWVISYGISQVAESKDMITGFFVFLAGMLSLGVMMVASWISTIRLLALTRIQLGFSQDYASGLKNISNKKWSIVGLYFLGTIIVSFLSGIWLAVIMISAVVGGKTQPLITAVGALTGLWGLVVTFSVYMLVGLISLIVLACEERPLMSVLGRGMQLTFRYFWRAMAFGGLLTLAYTVVSYPLSLPVVALTIFDMFRNGLMSPEGISETYKAPLYVMVVNQVWESLMSVILRPAMFFGFGLFYFDLRLRSDGLDINRRLESFKQKALVGR